MAPNSRSAGWYGIGCGADGDVFAPDFLAREVALGERAGILLHVNLGFEIAAVEIHVFVRVARVAILAAELAAPVGVYSPGEWNAIGIAVVQDRADGQKKVFRPALGIGAGGGSSEASNADQFRSRLRSLARDQSGRGSDAR